MTSPAVAILGTRHTTGPVACCRIRREKGRLQANTTESPVLMNTSDRVRGILRDALQLGTRADSFTPATQLLGAIPEFDSMAVVAVLTMIEDEFGFSVAD